MAYIAFLLLIFFMVTTIFKMEDGLQITLPRAETAAKQKRDRVSRIWIDAVGNISIQDKLVEVSQITDMPSGQRALFPHFRSDGWIYFTVKGGGSEFTVASDAAIVLAP